MHGQSYYSKRVHYRNFEDNIHVKNGYLKVLLNKDLLKRFNSRKISLTFM